METIQTRLARMERQLVKNRKMSHERAFEVASVVMRLENQERLVTALERIAEAIRK